LEKGFLKKSAVTGGRKTIKANRKSGVWGWSRCAKFNPNYPTKKIMLKLRVDETQSSRKLNTQGREQHVYSPLKQ